ncbi:pectinesterase inhibitor domain-containing protein [Artemisia annua]|uniref:Pectinesterase inhibitor domain-containing protein n=1 Tax=Artemisia annua TaxID=35608 RepID=A0A2U1N263_ARTAN|nr:pectinesterase inhibitor domain-containing protein [Artemisia annua]
MVKLSQVHGMSPRQVAAMKDCMELLSDSAYQMKKSLKAMNQPGSKDFRLVMSDIQTWLNRNRPTTDFNFHPHSGATECPIRSPVASTDCFQALCGSLREMCPISPGLVNHSSVTRSELTFTCVRKTVKNIRGDKIDGLVMRTKIERMSFWKIT